MVLTFFREKGAAFKPAWEATHADCKKSLNQHYNLERESLERKARGAGAGALPTQRKVAPRRRSIILEEYTNVYKSETFEPGKGKEGLQAKVEDTGNDFAKGGGGAFGMKQMFDQKLRRAAGEVENFMESVVAVAELKQKKAEEDAKLKAEGPIQAPWMKKAPTPEAKEQAKETQAQTIGKFLSKQAAGEGRDIGGFLSKLMFMKKVVGKFKGFCSAEAEMVQKVLRNEASPHPSPHSAPHSSHHSSHLTTLPLLTPHHSPLLTPLLTPYSLCA
jgi:hypothetical protein